MTPDLASTLTGLCDDVIAAADAAPVVISRVEMRLPVDFVLRREGGMATIAMAPPDPAALRGLALEPGRFGFSLVLGGGADVRD
jgi:hypothetical protein